MLSLKMSMPSSASVTSKAIDQVVLVSVSVTWITPVPTAVGVIEITPDIFPSDALLCLKFRMPMFSPSSLFISETVIEGFSARELIAERGIFVVVPSGITTYLDAVKLVKASNCSVAELFAVQYSSWSAVITPTSIVVIVLDALKSSILIEACSDSSAAKIV